mgnify:CR=1 FL=1|jgi:hypothetical protein
MNDSLKKGDLVELRIGIPIGSTYCRPGLYGVVISREEMYVYLVLLGGRQVLCYDHELELVTEYESM